MARILLIFGTLLFWSATANAQGRVLINPSGNPNHRAITMPHAKSEAPPAIADYSPGVGLPGTAVTITGTGFGPPAAGSTVTVLSAVTNTWTTWHATSWTDTQIVVSVPQTMPSGKVYLGVTVDHVQSVGTYPFTVGTPPEIFSVSPESGPPGTLVTITGAGFGAPTADSVLSVLSAKTNTWTRWTPTSWNDTQIVASVPSDAPDGEVYVYVTANKLQQVGTYAFVVGTLPVITDYSPGFGPPGTVLTIRGKGFGAPTYDSYFYALSLVTGVWSKWEPTRWSDTEIVVPVPVGMPLGKIFLVVEVEELQSLGWHPFTVGVPPSITSYSPTFGATGTLLTINGKGFGPAQGTSYISIQGAVTRAVTSWTPTSWADTQIVVPVPSTAPSGKVYLGVNVDKLDSIGTYPFTVGTPPEIDNYSPGFGSPGTLLTIHGKGFGVPASDSRVSVLSAVTNTWTTWTTVSLSDTEIVAAVPGGMPLGRVYLAVTVKQLQSVGTYPFSVGIPPSITSYSPQFGPAGTVLTINGKGFGAFQADSTVYVNSAATGAWIQWTPTGWTDTQITVPVPQSTPTGQNYLYITVSGLQTIGTYPFDLH